MRPAVGVVVCAGVLACSSMVSQPVASADDVQMPRPIRFPSEDGLQIEADLYMARAKTAPFIVLFHQAGWSRGEYREIGVRLVGLGFNAMAVDARAGGAVNKVPNQTRARALAAKKGTRFLDAEADLRAALRHARSKYASGPLIAWGSSYSSALVLHIAGENPELADAAMAFAPGEYFVKHGKPRTWIRDAAAKITKPVFITSARDEAAKWAAIYAAIGAKGKTSFTPKTAGNHGSRALWRKFDDSAAYWTAVEAFLEQFKEKRKKAR